MKTLNISISDLEYNKELTKQALNKCVQLAEKYKLSKMTMEEITNEVKSVK